MKNKIKEIKQRNDSAANEVVEEAVLLTGTCVSNKGFEDGYCIEGYSVNENGVYDEAGFRVTKTPIAPRKIFLDKKDYKVELAFFTLFDKSVSSCILSYKDIRNPNKIKCLAQNGVDVGQENCKQLSKYLTDVLTRYAAEIQRQKLTHFCGWHDEKFVPYDDSFQIAPELAGVISEALACAGSFQKWLEAFSIMRNNFLVRLIIACTCLAPLLSLLKINENPIINLVGSTGNGKTLILRFAASVFGNPVNHNLFRCANATNMNIASVASVFRNLPVFLDEAETASWTPEELMTWAQGYERGRLDKIEISKYTNVFLLTSESTVLPRRFNRGLLNRVLEFPMDTELAASGNIADFSALLVENYGHLGPRFIAKIKTMPPETLESLFLTHLNCLESQTDSMGNEVNSKMIRVLAGVMTADAILVQLFAECGFDFEHIDFKELINLYTDGRREDPADAGFYELCSVAAKNIVNGKSNLKKTSTGFTDLAAKCVYVERKVAENFREHFANWLASGKIEKYRQTYFTPILGRQFLKVIDSGALSFLAGNVTA